MNDEQIKKLIIETLQAEFKTSKKDFVGIATTICDKINTLVNDARPSRVSLKNSITKIQKDHKPVGHSVMTEKQSNMIDDENKRFLSKQTTK